MLKTICVMAALTAAILVTETQGQAYEAVSSISGMRDRYRPVLVFRPTESKDGRKCRAKYALQMRLLEEHSSNLIERDVVVVSIPPEEGQLAVAAGAAESLRRRFHVAAGDFAVILIGKDGDEKFRSRSPVTIGKLDALIDAMPMRQLEVRHGHHPE